MTTILFLLAGMAHGAVTSVPGVQIRDEGTSQGQATKINCSGSGISCSVAGGVGTLSVAGGGAGVGVSSSCATGQYWDAFNATSGSVDGGTCQTLPAGSEGNTYTSSKTFTAPVNLSSGSHHDGNIQINTLYGIRTDLSPSTFTPCGTMFFQSSNTVSGSTTTVGTAATYFSTFTLLGNTIRPGETLEVDCMFYQTAAPGTPVAGVYLDLVSRGTGASVVANAIIRYQTRITATKTGHGYAMTEAQSQTTAATALVSVTAGANLTGFPIDWTANHTINCRASRASGGNINFGWMRVSKSCQ